MASYGVFTKDIWFTVLYNADLPSISRLQAASRALRQLVQSLAPSVLPIIAIRELERSCFMQQSSLNLSLSNARRASLSLHKVQDQGSEVPQPADERLAIGTLHEYAIISCEDDHDGFYCHFAPPLPSAGRLAHALVALPGSSKAIVLDGISHFSRGAEFGMPVLLHNATSVPLHQADACSSSTIPADCTARTPAARHQHVACAVSDADVLVFGGCQNVNHSITATSPAACNIRSLRRCTNARCNQDVWRLHVQPDFLSTFWELLRTDGPLDVNAGAAVRLPRQGLVGLLTPSLSWHVYDATHNSWYRSQDISDTQRLITNAISKTSSICPVQIVGIFTYYTRTDRCSGCRLLILLRPDDDPKAYELDVYALNATLDAYAQISQVSPVGLHLPSPYASWQVGRTVFTVERSVNGSSTKLVAMYKHSLSYGWFRSHAAAAIHGAFPDVDHAQTVRTDTGGMVCIGGYDPKYGLRRSPCFLTPNRR